MAKKEVCPRDEIADPPGTAVLPIDMHGLAEGLVSFRTQCGVQSSLVRFALNRAIAWGPPQWQAPSETLCFSPAFSWAECSSQGYCKRVASVRWPKRFVVRCVRTAVAEFAHRMCTIWGKSLSPPLKCSSLTPHEAPELAKLQTESYV